MLNIECFGGFFGKRFSETREKKIRCGRKRERNAVPAGNSRSGDKKNVPAEKFRRERFCFKRKRFAYFLQPQQQQPSTFAMCWMSMRTLLE